MVEQEPAELVPRRLVLVLAGRGSVERVRPDMLVPPERVRIRAVLEQQAGGLDVAEETRERERLEAVVAERVGVGRTLGEELAQPFRPAERGGLEDVQVGTRRQQLVDPILLAAV